MLLGCGHDGDTTIHLAECLLEMPHLLVLPDRYPARGADGEREWRPVRKTTKCSDGFGKIEPHLERRGVIQRGRVGAVDVQVIRSRDIVRVAVDLLCRTPAALLCDDPECIHCPTSRRVLDGWSAPEVELLA
jgi:aminoglycoside N3'-acetyltransferase